MKTADLNTKLVDSYYTLLKNLSANNKLELIARLSKSMRTTKKTKDNSWKSLFGSFVLDQPVEEFVEGLKKDRTFSHNPVDL